MNSEATVKELAIYVGCTATLHLGELGVRVTVLDARKIWGRIDLQITPIAGNGQNWVSLASVSDLRTP
jgi:glycine/D-amino acid oxidase-like deaminating enzyme